MSIIKQAFDDIPQESKERVRLLCEEYDINYLKNQIKLCKDGIDNGNWEGYQENLAVRKSKLKELENELDRINRSLEKKTGYL